MLDLLLTVCLAVGCPATWDSGVPPAAALAPWRSPVAGPTLTAGEYLLLHPVRRLRADLDGDRRTEQIVVVPFETPDGEAAYSVAVLKRRGEDYESQLLLNCYASEFTALRLLRVRDRPLPLLLVSQEGGSGSFLSLDVFGWSGQRYTAAGALDGIYQGRYRLLRGSSRKIRGIRVTRAIAGDVNAYPRGSWRETYRWTAAGLTLESRSRVSRRPTVRLPRRVRPLASDR